MALLLGILSVSEKREFHSLTHSILSHNLWHFTYSFRSYHYFWSHFIMRWRKWMAFVASRKFTVMNLGGKFKVKYFFSSSNTKANEFPSAAAWNEHIEVSWDSTTLPNGWKNLNSANIFKEWMIFLWFFATNAKNSTHPVVCYSDGIKERNFSIWCFSAFSRDVAKCISIVATTKMNSSWFATNKIQKHMKCQISVYGLLCKQ